MPLLEPGTEPLINSRFCSLSIPTTVKPSWVDFLLPIWPGSFIPLNTLEGQALVGLPAIIRPSFTLASTGGGNAYNMEEFRENVARGLDL